MYLRGLDVGNIVVHALYESSDYDKELDDVGLTHRNTVNGTNPPWPSLSSDHKGVHRGNPGGTAPDAVTMEALGVDTYNVIGGSLTAPCTDEFAENHNTETPSLQYSKALYQEFVDNNGVTSPNQVGIYGGYGRFNSNKLFPFTAIRRGYFTQLRDSFSTQIKAKKGVNDDGDLNMAVY